MRTFIPGRPHPASPGEQALAPLLPDFESNVYRVCRHVDFVNDATRLVIEVDGYAFHSSPERFAQDRAQDVELAQAGYLVLRFSHSEVIASPRSVVHRILRVAEERGKQSLERQQSAMARYQLAQAEAQRQSDMLYSTRVKRLTRSIGNYFKDVSQSKSAAGNVVKAINAELRRRFGAASVRDEDANARAYQWLDDWWTRTRVSLDIRAADIPSWDAKVCECGRYMCEGTHCWRCGSSLDRGNSLGSDICIECSMDVYETCTACMQLASAIEIGAGGMCIKCQDIFLGEAG